MAEAKKKSDQLLEAFDRHVGRVSIPFTYRTAIFVVALMMVLLPAVYAGLIVLVGWLRPAAQVLGPPLLYSYLLLQMEYDADRYEVRVAGHESFETTFQRLATLSYASHLAASRTAAARLAAASRDIGAIVGASESVQNRQTLKNPDRRCLPPVSRRLSLP